MLCQNCGRRSSDTRSFCQYCGAVASPDMPPIAPARAGRPHESRQLDSRLRASKASGPAARPTGNSGGLSAIVFFIVTATALSWLTKQDNWKSLLDQLTGVSAPVRTAPPPRPARAPAAATPAPRSQAPASTGVASPSPAAAPQVQPGAAAGRRPATLPDVEGLSQDEVRQRLGAPLRSVVGGDGVTVWVYQNGALLVYFSKDKASLKPPR